MFSSVESFNNSVRKRSKQFHNKKVLLSAKKKKHWLSKEPTNHTFSFEGKKKKNTKTQMLLCTIDIGGVKFSSKTVSLFEKNHNLGLRHTQKNTFFVKQVA